jgi:hypothetical protein
MRGEPHHPARSAPVAARLIAAFHMTFPAVTVRTSAFLVYSHAQCLRTGHFGIALNEPARCCTAHPDGSGAG